MEITGMALYDSGKKEIHGIALQEAKKVAKETYPIYPQLDACRPLVGQDSVPNISATTSPTEGMLAQVSIIEIGLRNGGQINSFTGVYDELMRLANNSQMPPQNWSH